MTVSSWEDQCYECVKANGMDPAKTYVPKIETLAKDLVAGEKVDPAAVLAINKASLHVLALVKQLNIATSATEDDFFADKSRWSSVDVAILLAAEVAQAYKMVDPISTNSGQLPDKDGLLRMRYQHFFKSVHAIWQSAKGPWPLAPAVDWWLNRPGQATRNGKATGIVTYEHCDIRAAFDSDPCLDPLESVPVGHAMLPGLKELLPDFDEMDVFPALRLFESLHGRDNEVGMGLRILVNILLEIDLKMSPPIVGHGLLTTLTKREVLAPLYPRGLPRGQKLEAAGQTMSTAIAAWGLAGIPDHGGIRRVIGTIGPWNVLPPDYPLDGPITFQVYFPRSAKTGALLQRDIMNFLGVSHAPMYRTMLSLCHQWSRAARTKGKYKRGPDKGKTKGTTFPYATRPARLRNEKGKLIDKDGNELDTDNWNDSRTVPDPSSEREPNPAIQFLPAYTEDRILRLCYSSAQLEAAEKTGNMHTYKNRAWQTIRWMERLGLLDMAVHADGALRLCPPRGWGVQFPTPAKVKLLGSRQSPLLEWRKEDAEKRKKAQFSRQLSILG